MENEYIKDICQEFLNFSATCNDTKTNKVSFVSIHTKWNKYQLCDTCNNINFIAA